VSEQYVLPGYEHDDGYNVAVAQRVADDALTEFVQEGATKTCTAGVRLAQVYALLALANEVRELKVIMKRMDSRK
jgi:hypothetical protein